MAARLRDAGAVATMMDVSIVGDPPYVADHSKHAVAAAAGVTIAEVLASGDENTAMTLMSQGATALAKRLQRAGMVDGVIILGGTLGTDLALDVTAALPIGLPKFIVSTIAYSHLIPPHRVAPDLMMILWSGGLYGLNDVCRSVLSQACGAIAGAARHATPLQRARPLIGMTSLGSSCLKYMKDLRPQLEARGYDVAVFHATGMGGCAFEAIAADGGFAAVFDFCIQEVSNHHYETVVTSGPARLEGAGRAGVPQIVAPGAIDMIDFQSWQNPPTALADRPYHAHNRLVGSVTSSPQGRREVARVVARKLSSAKARTAFLLPVRGLQEWDKPGEALHDPEGLRAFNDEIRAAMPANVEFEEVDTHINDPAFSERALAVFDNWVACGVVARGRHEQ